MQNLQMHGWGTHPFQNSFSSLLKDPKTTLENVLRHQQFQTILRQESVDILDFLFRGDVVERMVEYAFTNQLKLEPDSHRFEMMCVGILSWEGQKIQERIATNSFLLDSVQAFPYSPCCRDPVICGHFQRIVERIVRSTNGEVLGTKFDFLPDFLINNVHLLGIRELLFSMIVNYTIPFCVSCQMIVTLIQNARRSFPTIRLIRDILTEKPDLGTLFESEECLSPLFEIGISNYENKPLVALESFGILYTIIAASGNSELKQYHLKYDFSLASDINCATPAALQVFHGQISDLLPSFFQGRLSTILNKTIRHVMSEMSLEEMQNLVTKTHLCRLAIEYYASYKQRKINGHFLDVLMIISEKGMCCCHEHLEDWERFVVKQLAGRYRKVMSHYGGEPTKEMGTVQRDLFASLDDLYSVLEGGEEEDAIVNSG
jgi:hypothetical protein